MKRLLVLLYLAALVGAAGCARAPMTPCVPCGPTGIVSPPPPEQATQSVQDGTTAAIPLVNRLGNKIVAVYAHAPGHEPWPIAGPVEDGGTVMVDPATLRASRRLLVLDENAAEDHWPPMQFFAGTYLDDATYLELALRPDVPGEDGGRPWLLSVGKTPEGETWADAAPAGLPFNILLSHLESEEGLDAARYAELMFPLAADGWDNYGYAMVSEGISWHLLSPGPHFGKVENGKRLLSILAFWAVLDTEALSKFLGEIDGHSIEPLWLKLGNGTVFAFDEEGFAEVEERYKAPGVYRDRLSAWVATQYSKDNADLSLALASILAQYESRAYFNGRLVAWLATHSTNDPPDMLLALASPLAMYELGAYFNRETKTMEFHFLGDPRRNCEYFGPAPGP